MTSRANDLANLMSSTTVGTRDLTLDSDFSANTIASTTSVTANTIASTTSVTDSVGDVRTPRRVQHATDATISDEGVYLLQTGVSTITLGAPAEGTVMALYNNTAGNVTLEDGDTITSMRLSDGTGSHNNTLTIATRTLATVTVIASNACVVTGSDVSI